jgi:hypothetical protein
LDAIRILDACFRHAKTRNPVLLDIPNRGVFDGYRIADSIIPFSLANITRNCNDDDAVLEFHSKTDAVASIHLHPERQTLFYIRNNERRLNTSTAFRRAFPIDIVIVPTLAPLEAEEFYVEDETVKRNAATSLNNSLGDFGLGVKVGRTRA